MIRSRSSARDMQTIPIAIRADRKIAVIGLDDIRAITWQIQLQSILFRNRSRFFIGNRIPADGQCRKLRHTIRGHEHRRQCDLRRHEAGRCIFRRRVGPGRHSIGRLVCREHSDAIRRRIAAIYGHRRIVGDLDRILVAVAGDAGQCHGISLAVLDVARKHEVRSIQGCACLADRKSTRPRRGRTLRCRRRMPEVDVAAIGTDLQTIAECIAVIRCIPGAALADSQCDLPRILAHQVARKERILIGQVDCDLTTISSLHIARQLDRLILAGIHFQNCRRSRDSSFRAAIQSRLRGSCLPLCQQYIASLRGIDNGNIPGQADRLARICSHYLRISVLYRDICRIRPAAPIDAVLIAIDSQ